MRGYTSALMTFGTCQVSDVRVVFAPMETMIQRHSYRRSQALPLLGFASLVGLCALVSFLYHHPQIEVENIVGRLASVAFCVAIIRDHSALLTRRRACRIRPMRSPEMLLRLERH
jgi:hypothetical protein